MLNIKTNSRFKRILQSLNKNNPVKVKRNKNRAKLNNNSNLVKPIH